MTEKYMGFGRVPIEKYFPYKDKVNKEVGVFMTNGSCHYGIYRGIEDDKAVLSPFLRSNMDSNGKTIYDVSEERHELNINSISGIIPQSKNNLARILNNLNNPVNKSEKLFVDKVYLNISKVFTSIKKEIIFTSDRLREAAVDKVYCKTPGLIKDVIRSLPY